MIKAIKIRLLPIRVQEVQLWKSANISRFAYNWALGKQVNHFNELGKLKKIPEGELRKELTQLKNTEEYEWLYEVSNNVAKQAVKDLCLAIDNFHSESRKHGYRYRKSAIKSKRPLTFQDFMDFPRFKSKKKSKISFYNDTDKLKVKEDCVLIEKVGWVKLAEVNRIPLGVKYTNPRITFDHKYWYVSVGVEKEEVKQELTDVSMGIDLGLKDFAVCSHIDEHYKNINKTKKVKKLKKKLRRVKRQISGKYENNKQKVGENRYIYQKTNNIKKQEHKVKLLERKLFNIRNNYLHQISNDIVKTKPYRVVIEDLNISGMMKNRHLAKAIAEQCFYRFTMMLEYKCKFNGITLVRADRFYPSSKTCSCCGYIKKDLRLKDRNYKCDSCGFTLNRDKNASINLSRYKLA